MSNEHSSDERAETQGNDTRPRYRILCEQSITDLNRIVNVYLTDNDDWECQGGASAVYRHHGETDYMQAMVNLAHRH